MDKLLTKLQAYHATIRFLEIYYGQTKSDDLGSLLGAMSFLVDGSTADPAIWSDWLDSLKVVHNAEEDSLTNLQSFIAMRRFVEIYYEFTASNDALSILHDSQILEDGATRNKAAWENWNKCIDIVLQETNNKHYLLF